MQTSFVRSTQMARLALLFAGTFSGLRVSAQTVQVPPAPPGGLNYSKLPDVMGINLGMPVPQAVAIVKSKWPAGQVNLFYTKFANSSDPAWISRVTAKRPGTGLNQANSVDDITVFFSAPPNPQVVVQVLRTSSMIPPTARGNLIAALRQKYGPELKQAQGYNMAWEFDEQGQPVAKMPMGYMCTTFNQPPQATQGTASPPEALNLAPPFVEPIDGDIPRLVNMCKDAITITTLVNAGQDPNQLLSTSTVDMIDHAEDLRDYVATARYSQKLASAAADKQKQQQLKNAPGAPRL
jgi:hypothetical protein